MDGKTIGILGGGQLGRMLVEAAHRLNVKTIILDQPNSPAKQINALDEHVDGSFTDLDSITKLAKKCDVLTVEIEHVDVEALRSVSKSLNIPIYPLPETIRLIQDKYLQKTHLQSHGVAVVESVSVPENNEAELRKIGSDFGYPYMLKSRTLAYDGRGNFVVKSADSITEALEFLADRPLYAEKWCPFVKELAVMVVRSIEGEVFSYPTVETIHKENICHLVYAPARITDTLCEKASIMAKNAVKSFPGCGIFGVEMFLLPNHELLINEIAPRPHNSGHYTIDACVTTQFEAHVRAVVGLPLPKNFTSFATTNTNAIMLNVLGDVEKKDGELAICRRALETPNASVYLYGKESKPKRKMGHINIIGSSMEAAQAKLEYIMGEKSEVPESIVEKEKPLVSIIMGSDSDLPVMSVGANILKKFGVPFELTIVSAHRTPHRMSKFAIEAASRGIKVVIAGAGGAAHLPGMVAAMTPLPVIGVPVKGSTLDGVDSLHSIVQMPRGIPVATVAINNSTNAALLAVRILGVSDYKWLEEMSKYMSSMEEEVLGKAERLEAVGYEKY
ncbi:putative phosphoribosyl-aminoimidazole carboxylase [Clavispora lusitaniae]|uniref:Phosphoribosyl-aminoimidazole carboxylase n=1 Tax=Clavispora lusitaniae TaxID=36911 RepID=A0ACD0WNJ8_CLALS|nr:putative phosphoribosyl-aminoimidazole carboxylase [Clavispora lusitaniae]QFZ34592.1 putative phosphoribosyl-aminoimidazole carboxylase [Clavispora lusitaniae]QFZ40277.1 putative phosphoribosyl-aminoimidazole carboxylase [Clavispora lusitaniae]QFZ45957.1 putative phosphoribosyl-aminoimidazole carboxylase [Clavispora lusitaniae]QFZ51619.1 putative phosphoribosyl-aminoimidazole carboxylase [Clavispora lusitaniae]